MPLARGWTCKRRIASLGGAAGDLYGSVLLAQLPPVLQAPSHQDGAAEDVLGRVLEAEQTRLRLDPPAPLRERGSLGMVPVRRARLPVAALR